MRRRPEKGTSGVARSEDRGRGRAARADARVRGGDVAVCLKAEARLVVVAARGTHSAEKRRDVSGLSSSALFPRQQGRPMGLTRMAGFLFHPKKVPEGPATPRDASNARDAPSLRASLRLFPLVSPSRSHLRARRAPRRGGISRGYPRETKKRSKRRFFRASEGCIPRPPPPRFAAPRVLYPRRAASLFTTLSPPPPPSTCPRHSPS